MFGDFGGRGWEWIANFYALGGLFLLYKRIIPWQVPVAMLATVIVLTVPFWMSDPDVHPFPLQHVFSGAMMLGAFFIARSEEHTSELQSLMRISYAVFCLKKNKDTQHTLAHT